MGRDEGGRDSGAMRLLDLFCGAGGAARLACMAVSLTAGCYGVVAMALSSDARRVSRKARKRWVIDWMEWRELAESIPPAFTEHIGRQFIAAIREGSSGMDGGRACGREGRP